MGCILLTAVSAGIGLMLLLLAGDFLIVSDGLEKADAVVALSGGSPERLKESADLVLDRYSEYLILTNIDRQLPDGTGVTDSMRMDAILMGVSPYHILVTERVVNSTQDEAKAVRNLMELRGLKSCIVVTDPYHSRRTRIIFGDVFRGRKVSVRVYAVKDSSYQPGRWFLSLRGWQDTMNEYVKLAYYEIFRK